MALARISKFINLYDLVRCNNICTSTCVCLEKSELFRLSVCGQFENDNIIKM